LGCAAIDVPGPARRQQRRDCALDCSLERMLLRSRYDDGGPSGGTLEWPPRLLQGIALAWADQRNAFGFSR